MLRRVAIVGAGAVGAAYAERFDALDRDHLEVIAGGERRERLLASGLVVNGRRFAVRCVAPEEAAPADLLLFAVKQHHLAEAIADARGAVGPETIVLSLLNGISSEEELARAYGADHVLPAFVIGNDVVREGGSIRYTRLGKLVFGAPSNDPADPRVRAVAELLERAAIPYEVPADLRREQWWKWMINVAVNQVSALLRAPYGAFATVPEVRSLARAAALEVAALAPREGVALGPEDVDRIFPVLATLAPDGKTSMLQDVEAGRKTEVDAFAGTVVALGKRHGVPTPVNELLGTALAALERLAGVRV